MAEIREYSEVQFRERVSEPVGNGLARHIKLLADERRRFFRDMADPNTINCVDTESGRVTEYPWSLVCYAKVTEARKPAAKAPPADSKGTRSSSALTAP